MSILSLEIIQSRFLILEIKRLKKVSFLRLNLLIIPTLFSQVKMFKFYPQIRNPLLFAFVQFVKLLWFRFERGKEFLFSFNRLTM